MMAGQPKHIHSVVRVTHAGSPAKHQLTLCGRPKAGWCAQRCSMTSRRSAFWPLYVVRMEIFSAGYPSRRMYWNTDTTYSASPRFW